MRDQRIGPLGRSGIPAGAGMLGIQTPAAEPDVNWGELRARGRTRGVQRAAQFNRLRDSDRNGQIVDFGVAGPARIERRGSQVTIVFLLNGTTATGTFVDVPGRPEMIFRNLRFRSRFDIRSAPTEIRVFTTPEGRLKAELDQSLIVDAGVGQVRAIREKTGIFPLDE